jgi:hypothetical protein
MIKIKGTKESSILYYFLTFALIIASFTILFQKKMISKLAKYEKQYVGVQYWIHSNSLLSERINGKVDLTIRQANLYDSYLNQNSVVLLFDYNYCNSCLKKELSRLESLTITRQVGIFTTPRNKREVEALTENKLIGIDVVGVFNPAGFWTPDMSEILVYLKISNGIVVDLLLVDEMYSNYLDEWLSME